MPEGSASDPSRRNLLAVVALLLAVLLIGGIVVAKSLFAPPAPAQAAKPLHDGVSAIEAGLEAASQYQRERKFAEAAAILDKLSQQSPTDRAVRLAYAQALIGQNKHAEAYKQYEAAIALSGETSSKPGVPAADSVPVGLKRDPSLAQIHYEAGTCANQSGQIDRAEEHYSMAQMLDPPEARYPLYLAMIQIKKGEDAAASASLIRAIKLNPDLAEAWGTMAELELRKNQNGLATQHIEKARTLQPEVTRWKIDQARALNRQGDAEQAAAILQSLSPSERANPDILALQAETYGLLKKPADAAAMYESASRQAPADAEIAYQAALWFDRAGDKAKATTFAKRAQMLGNDAASDLLNRLTQGDK